MELIVKKDGEVLNESMNFIAFIAHEDGDVEEGVSAIVSINGDRQTQLQVISAMIATCDTLFKHALGREDKTVADYSGFFNK